MESARNTSSIIDADVEELVSCIVCNENFDHTRRVPKGLPCMHTMCLVCARSIAKKADDSKWMLQCPECRRRHLLDGGVNSLPTNIMAVRLMSAKSDAEIQRKQEDMRSVLMQNLDGLKSYKAACQRQMETDYTKQYEVAQTQAAAAKTYVDDGMQKLMKEMEGLIYDRKRELYAEIDLKTSNQIAKVTEQRQDILAIIANTQSKTETLLTQDKLAEHSFSACCEEILSVLRNPTPADNSKVTVEFGPLSLCSYGEVIVMEEDAPPVSPLESCGKLSLFGLKQSPAPRRRPAVIKKNIGGKDNKADKSDIPSDEQKSGTSKSSGLTKYLQRLKGILPSKSNDAASSTQSKTVWFHPEDEHKSEQTTATIDSKGSGGE